MIDVILVDQPVIDRIPQSHPRLLGSKQRGPLQWGGVQVITCTLQELDWFTYLRSGLVGISGAIFSSFHPLLRCIISDLILQERSFHQHPCYHI